MIKALQAAGITGLILIGAWAAETFIETVRPRTGLAWRLLVFLGLGLLIFGLSIHALRAHDRGLQTNSFARAWNRTSNPLKGLPSSHAKLACKQINLPHFTS